MYAAHHRFRVLRRPAVEFGR